MRPFAGHPMGGRQTVPTSDDKPLCNWDRAHMPAQAISLDTSIGDPIAALKRVGGVRQSRRMRQAAIAGAVLVAATVVAGATPPRVGTVWRALLRGGRT